MKSPMMQAAALWGCRSVSFALSAGAVIGFMAGSLEVASWSYVQWFYGVVGLGLAAVLTAFVSGAYASGHWLAVVLAAAISIGLELSQTLERADALQRSRSSESVLSRAAMAQLEGETVTLTPAAKALAAAKARLANLRVSEANRTLRQQLKQDVDRLGIEVGMEDQARAQHRASLQQQVKDTQQDSSHSHAGIRLLMTLFGLSLAEASGAFGLALIAAFQAAFWWVASAASKVAPVQKKSQTVVLAPVAPMEKSSAAIAPESAVAAVKDAQKEVAPNKAAAVKADFYQCTKPAPVDVEPTIGAVAPMPFTEAADVVAPVDSVAPIIVAAPMTEVAPVDESAPVVEVAPVSANQGAVMLFNWLKSCPNGESTTRDARKFCPRQVREKDAFHAALGVLVSTGMVVAETIGRSTKIRILNKEV